MDKTHGCCRDRALLIQTEINDGQMLLDRLAEAGIAVGAGWVMESDAWQWFVSRDSLVGRDGERGRLTGRFLRFSPMPQPLAIDPFQLKVVGPTEPVGKAI
jgi:hypothetical protein